MSSIKRKKRNQTILVSVLVLIVLLVIFIELVPQKISQSNEVQKLNSTDVYSRLQSGEKIIILDVREENEFLEEHIPNAIWFPKSKFDKNDPSVMEILENVSKSGVIVTYCGAGHRSGWVALNLKEMGYNAYNLDGISFWKKAGLPTVKGPKLPPTLEPQRIYLEEAYYMYKNFDDVVWVDVRDGEEYDAGHIKGAINIPVTEIEYRMSELPRDQDIILYCTGTFGGGYCSASLSAGRILLKNGFGFGKIKVFEDGYPAWENADYPVER